jgi:hypothetical protein
VIGGGNGNNDMTHVTGEDQRQDSLPGSASAAHLLSGQEGSVTLLVLWYLFYRYLHVSPGTACKKTAQK